LCHLRVQSAIMTSYSTFSYTQPAMAPNVNMALTEVVTSGGSVVSCYASPTTVTYVTTDTWIATGDGCALGYSSQSPSNTGYYGSCIYTGDYVATLGWGCTFAYDGGTSTVYADGGTTTEANQPSVTMTGGTQIITVTRTEQATTTSTSVSDPGAHTSTITSTVTQQASSNSRKRGVVQGVIPIQPFLPRPNYHMFEDRESNITAQLMDRQLTCDSGMFLCNNGYCCDDGSACMGQALCCPESDGYGGCLSMDPYAGFSYTMSYTVETTYETVTVSTTATTNVPSGTAYASDVSTKYITTTNTNTATATTTMEVDTVTVTYYVTKTLSNAATTSSSTTSGSTTGSQTSTTASSASASQTTTGSPDPVPVSNNLATKVGVGVGVPLGVALIGALAFIFLRHRKNAKQSPTGNGTQAFSGGDPHGPGGPKTFGAMSSGRPISELPSYGAAAAASPMSHGQKPGELPVNTTVHPVPMEEVHQQYPHHSQPQQEQPQQQYNQPQQDPRFSPSPSQQQYYQPQQDPRFSPPQPSQFSQPSQDFQIYQEVPGDSRRYEMPSPVHEMHELPGHYGG